MKMSTGTFVWTEKVFFSVNGEFLGCNFCGDMQENVVKSTCGRARSGKIIRRDDDFPVQNLTRY